VEAFAGFSQWGAGPAVDYYFAQNQLNSLRKQDTWAQQGFDERSGTTEAENKALKFALLPNASVYNEGTFCGKYMVCIVNAGFAANGQDIFTTGRVVVTGNRTLSAEEQAHEYGHVGEQLTRGYEGFIADYAAAGVMKYMSGLRRDSLHEVTVIEDYNNKRQ